MDAWNTIELTLNKDDSTKVDVYINGVYAGKSSGDQTDYFSEIILNNYNYGTDSYNVRWSAVQTGNYKPAAPSNLRFYRGSTSVATGSTVNYADVQLRWDTVANAERYQVRVTDPSGAQ